MGRFSVRSFVRSFIPTNLVSLFKSKSEFAVVEQTQRFDRLVLVRDFHKCVKCEVCLWIFGTVGCPGEVNELEVVEGSAVSI